MKRHHEDHDTAVIPSSVSLPFTVQVLERWRISIPSEDTAVGWILIDSTGLLSMNTDKMTGGKIGYNNLGV